MPITDEPAAVKPASSLLLLRVSIALVWLYNGAWCKLLGRTPRHTDLIAGVPLLNPSQAHALVLALGLVECGIAGWALSGLRARAAALTQTVLLLSMNAGGIAWGGRSIPDPAGMLIQNFAFLLLAWVAAGELRPYDARS